MIRSIFHIALTFIILLSGMNYSLVQVHFRFNRAEIAAVYCENKSQPELKCNGSCELDKRLSDTQEKQKERDKIFFEEFQFIYLATEQYESLGRTSNIQTDLYENVNQLEVFEIQLDFFHPPRRA